MCDFSVWKRTGTCTKTNTSARTLTSTCIHFSRQAERWSGHSCCPIDSHTSADCDQPCLAKQIHAFRAHKRQADWPAGRIFFPTIVQCYHLTSSHSMSSSVSDTQNDRCFGQSSCSVDTCDFAWEVVYLCPVHERKKDWLCGRGGLSMSST